MNGLNWHVWVYLDSFEGNLFLTFLFLALKAISHLVKVEKGRQYDLSFTETFECTPWPDGSLRGHRGLMGAWVTIMVMTS